MFRGIIGYEFKKLFIRRNIIILIVLFIFLAFLCWDGIGDYKKIEANKKPFQEMERDKVSMHLHYTFYGVRGVRLLYIPGPLSVIFNDSAVFDGMMSHVDSAEKLEISNSFKGKDLFSDSGGFMDFAGLMLLISCFVALIYGWDGTRNLDYLKFISGISGFSKQGFLISLARIILLNIVFWVLSGLVLVWILINGINAANIFYLVYVLVLTLIITSFVAAGAVIGSLKSKVAQFITMPVLYLLLVLVIPWLIHRAVYMEAKEGIKSIYEFEYQSFKYMMDFEKRFYNRFKVWKSGEVAPDDVKAMIQSGQKVEYNKLRETELNRIEGIVKRIRVYQTLASLFPTTFYISTNKELSSKGFQNFIAFYRYSYNMKQDFIKFYIDRKFYRPLPKSGVEPFIKGNNDLFYGKSSLPFNFWLGVFLTPFYTVLLLFLSFILLKKRQKVPEPQKAYRIEKEKDNPLFVLCENEEIKTDIFNYFQNQKASVCLEKINTGDFMFNGVTPQELIKHLCMVSRVDEKKALENLGYMGIKDLSIFKLDEETILKIYAAVITAAEFELMVLNDFVKKESRKFEFELFKLLSKLVKDGKKIIYLSCEMKQGANSVENNIRVNEFETFHLGLDKDTLR
jgi:hypothetical protein